VTGCANCAEDLIHYKNENQLLLQKVSELESKVIGETTKTGLIKSRSDALERALEASTLALSTLKEALASQKSITFALESKVIILEKQNSRLKFQRNLFGIGGLAIGFGAGYSFGVRIQF
jgi:hypothetical protein